MKLFLFIAACFLSTGKAQVSLDTYGGFTAKPIQAGTGYFTTAKVAGRWWLVTPLGNAFWMRAVYDGYENNISSSLLSAKYGAGYGGLWYGFRNQRYLKWGFNTIGEYTGSGGLPVGVYGSSGYNSPQLPFIVLLTPAQDIAMNDNDGCTDQGKDIIRGVPAGTYNGWRGSIQADPYDPCFAKAAAYEVGYWNGIINGGFGNKPWVVGVTTDDSDSLPCFKGSGGSNYLNPYPDCAFLTATAAPTYSTAMNIASPTAFHDPTLYAKAAWITYLKGKYANVAALNAAWGTSGFYTSFDETPLSVTGEVDWVVGSRTIPAYSGMDRTNNTTTDDTSCAPRGSGSCTGVWVHYNSPCTSSTLQVGDSITIASAPGGNIPGGDPTPSPNNFNGTFTVTAVLNGNPYACIVMYAQTASSYDEGPNSSSTTGTISFTESVTTFNFTLAKSPITASTVTISIPGSVTATDDGSGHLTGSGIAALSTIDYSTGAVILNLNSAPPSGSITSSYTGSGYGAGTGVIDEDGRHTTWMGTEGLNNYVNNASAGVQTDLDAFDYLFAKRYAQVVAAAIHAVDTNHLIFGPAAINNYGQPGRPKILHGLSDGGIDVFQLSYDPNMGPLAGNMVNNNATYDLVGKPAYIWYSVVSNADSRYSASPGSNGSPQFATQATRGAHMRDVDLPAFLNARGSNGDYYVVGYDWWSLYDSGTEGGGTNWGLITFSDNAYDGVEDVTGAPTCSTPIQAYSCGGEPGNYGDFLTAAEQANTNLVNSLLAGDSTPSPSLIKCALLKGILVQ